MRIRKDRITSYNVCYTKLLRLFDDGTVVEHGDEKPAGWGVDIVDVADFGSEGFADRERDLRVDDSLGLHKVQNPPHQLSAVGLGQPHADPHLHDERLGAPGIHRMREGRLQFV